VLSLKSNGLLNKESGEALAGVLKANSVLTKLDISSNYDPFSSSRSIDGVGFAQALAVGLIDNGALLVLSLKSNNLHADGGKALAKGLKGNTVITQLDISSNALGLDSNYHEGMSGVIALADAIPGMRAMTGLDLSSNNIVGSVPSLVNAIAQLSTLTQVNLSGNDKILPGAWE
jgi:hypothetical protein